MGLMERRRVVVLKQINDAVAQHNAKVNSVKGGKDVTVITTSDVNILLELSSKIAKGFPRSRIGLSRELEGVNDTPSANVPTGQTKTATVTDSTTPRPESAETQPETSTPTSSWLHKMLEDKREVLISSVGALAMLVGMFVFFEMCIVAKVPYDLTISSKQSGQSSNFNNAPSYAAFFSRQVASMPVGYAPTCSQTTREANPAWMLDLGDTYSIASIQFSTLPECVNPEGSMLTVTITEPVDGLNGRKFGCGGVVPWEDTLLDVTKQECAYRPGRYISIQFNVDTDNKSQLYQLCLCHVRVLGVPVSWMSGNAVPKAIPGVRVNFPTCSA